MRDSIIPGGIVYFTCLCRVSRVPTKWVANNSRTQAHTRNPLRARRERSRYKPIPRFQLLQVMMLQKRKIGGGELKLARSKWTRGTRINRIMVLSSVADIFRSCSVGWMMMAVRRDVKKPWRATA